ncbi:MAG: ABC transporter substrate-binding protein [Candidatus Bathyarchaeia archaeon]
MAESWEILDGGKRYVFHIDKRAKWSDGTPLTAMDVEYTWNLTMTYSFPAALKGILQAVMAVDNYTVEFITSVPYVNWDTSFGASTIIPKHIFSKLEDPLTYEFINDPSKHVTSGPFIYDSYMAGQWFLFRRRPDYWKTGSMPKVDGIMLVYIGDYALVPLYLEKGEIDISPTMFLHLLGQIIGKPNIAIWWYPYMTSLEFLMVNTRLYPLNMKEVRQAIDLAIDKVDIAQSFFWGLAIPANRSMINLAAFPEYHVPEAVWPGLSRTHRENVEEANRILDELGFTRGPDGVRVTPNGTRLSYKYLVQLAAHAPLRLRAGEEIVDYLKEIGIEVSVFQPLAVGDFFMATFFAEKKDWGFAQIVSAEPVHPYDAQINWWITPVVGLSGIAATGWYSEEVDALGHSALQKMDYNELVAEVKKIIKIFADELPVIPIAFLKAAMVYRTDKITNITPEHCSVGLTGMPWPTRLMMICEYAPIKPSPTLTPTPAATPTPTHVVTPTPMLTPTATPAGLTAEQAIAVAVVIIVIIGVVAYVAKTRKKKQT